jgi:hypothetical protein
LAEALLIAFLWQNVLVADIAFHSGREHAARFVALVPVAAALLTVVGPALGQPQWSVTVFHPGGAFLSEVWSLAPGQQAGRVQLASQPTNSQAAIWSGSANNWQSLGPGGVIYGTTGTQQVGFQNTGSAATLWSGTPQSAVTLTPWGLPGLSNAEAYGIAGDQQVGRARINNQDHAAMWTGSAASFIDLNPPGALGSVAYATDGVRQWGSAGVNTSLGPKAHAGYWTGVGASFVDLNPAEGMESGVRGVGGGQLAGAITYPAAPLITHAATCQGTAESWLDLHAFGALGESYLYATTGSVQVGWSHVPGFSFPHAGVWFGTAASFSDLTQFLPPGFGGESSATSIIIDQGKIIIGGYADGPSGQHQAVIWTRDIPAPPSLALAGLLMLAPRRRRRGSSDKAGNCGSASDGGGVSAAGFGGPRRRR